MLNPFIKINRPKRADPTCLSKARWVDSMSATAGAIHALEVIRDQNADGPSRLFIYHCPHCYGWHLTRRVCGEAITLEGGNG